MTMRIFYIFFIYEPQKKPQVGTGKFTFTGNKLLIIQYYFSCLACTQRGMDPFQISSDGWHAERYLRYYSSTTGTRQKSFLRKNGLGKSRCCCLPRWVDVLLFLPVGCNSRYVCTALMLYKSVLRSRAIFPRLRRQVKNFGSGSTNKSSAPTGSDSQKQILIQNLWKI